MEGNVVLTVLQNESILPLVLSSLKGNSSVIGNYIYLNPQVSDGNADLTFISNSVANLSATQFLNALVDLSPLSSMALSQSTYQNNLQMAVVLDKQFQKNVRTNRARHLNNQRSKKMEFEAPCSATPKTGLFIEPIGVFYHQRQTNGPLTNSGQIGFTSYTYGAGLGYEYVIDNQFVVEGGVGYTHSNLNFDANFGNAWWSSVYVAPFFGWFNERAFGNFMVMGAFNFIRNHRRVAFPGVERVARSKYTSYDLLLRGNGGARLAMGNNFWFQPEGTLNYLTIFIPNYTEKDAGAISLNYKANVIYIMQPSFRGKLIKEYTSEKFCYAPNIYVGWLANILLKNQTSTARFRDAPDNLFFTISGYHKTTNQLVLGAEFYAQRFNQFILTSNFEVDMLSKFEVYTVKVKFEWFF